MKRISPHVLSLLAAPLLLSFLLYGAQDSEEEEPAPRAGVTVIAVRHAEKRSDDARDPALSEAGETRSKTLSRLLSKSGVTHVYSTAYRRTRATVAPLAELLRLEVNDYSPREIESFVKELRELPAGSVALVAGHSNTTPGLVLAMGGEVDDLESMRGTSVLGEEQYDRLFVTTLPPNGGAVKTLELRYGDESK